MAGKNHISDKIIDYLSSKISYRALKSMAVGELRISEAEITNIEDENEKDTANRSRTILRKWRNRNPEKKGQVFAHIISSEKESQ